MVNLREEIKAIRKTHMEMLEKTNDQTDLHGEKHEACPRHAPAISNTARMSTVSPSNL